MKLLALASLAGALPLSPLSVLDMLATGSELDPQSKPVIDTDALQDLITTDALEAWAEKLWVAANASTPHIGHPTRYIGTPGHAATLELITGLLDELSDYYTYEVQPFTVQASRVHNWTVTHNGKAIESKPLRMTPAAEPLEAPVHFVPNGGCRPSDYSAGGGSQVDGTCKGKVLVIERGKCPFGDKSELAGLAGAAGVLLWDPELDANSVLSNADLGSPLSHQVATLGISGATATALREDDVVVLAVDAEIFETETSNVIAETKHGDHDNVVFAGAHSDSVLAGPGLNDNGSGAMTLLEVARQLANFEVRNAVRLAWWSAEELGLKGSLHYTENLAGVEAAKIRMFLDYDMMASPNHKYEIYNSDDSENPAGSSALRDMYVAWYEKHGLNYTLQPFDGRSDYVGFVEIGVPSSGIDAGVEEIKTREEVAEFGGTAGMPYDVCYHLACDTLDNLDYEPWLVNTRLVAHSVAVYATDLTGFPKRSNAYYHERVHQPRKWPGSPLS